MSTYDQPHESAYDPYIPSGSAAAQASPAQAHAPGSSTQSGNGTNRTAQIQAQIDDTVGVMRDNINKVHERGENLNALQDKTDNLVVSSRAFTQGASRVRRKMWWKDMKMRLVIILGVLAIIAVIVIPIAVKTSK